MRKLKNVQNRVTQGLRHCVVLLMEFQKQVSYFTGSDRSFEVLTKVAVR